MSTQPITDYLTKQIFIEKNVVTYRSLSRHFSLHVNVAKNELATYHHNAPYQSQICFAAFLISGRPRGQLSECTEDGDEEDDVIMDNTQPLRVEEEEAGGEEVPQTRIIIVNENDLEDAKASYDDIFSVHVYSLSPAPLHDVDLICDPTNFIRDTDKSKAPEFASTVGRLVGRGIKMGHARMRALPPLVAGPSNLKRPAALGSKMVDKTEAKEKPTAAPATERRKPSGRIDFFKRVEKAKGTKEFKEDVKPIKEEIPEEKKRMFFQKVPSNHTSKPISRDPSPETKVISPKSEKGQSSRGVKRKSSAEVEPKRRSSDKPLTQQAETNLRVKRKAIISDDESDAPPTKAHGRKIKPGLDFESTEISEAEREAMAIMDVDDDHVEKISRNPSDKTSSNEETDEASSVAQEDVVMEVDEHAKPGVTRKRKPKTVVPVGRNGLKKVKIQKSRKVKDTNGYMVTEDYSDWESVDEEDRPKSKPKIKTRAKLAEVEKEGEGETHPLPVKDKETAPKKTASKTDSSTVKTKLVAKGGNKNQKGLTNFFGPRKVAS